MQNANKSIISSMQDFIFFFPSKYLYITAPITISLFNLFILDVSANISTTPFFAILFVLEIIWSLLTPVLFMLPMTNLKRYMDIEFIVLGCTVINYEIILLSYIAILVNSIIPKYTLFIIISLVGLYFLIAASWIIYKYKFIFHLKKRSNRRTIIPFSKCLLIVVAIRATMKLLQINLDKTAILFLLCFLFLSFSLVSEMFYRVYLLHKYKDLLYEGMDEYFAPLTPKGKNWKVQPIFLEDKENLRRKNIIENVIPTAIILLACILMFFGVEMYSFAFLILFFCGIAPIWLVYANIRYAVNVNEYNFIPKIAIMVLNIMGCVMVTSITLGIVSPKVDWFVLISVYWYWGIPICIVAVLGIFFQIYLSIKKREDGLT